MRLTRDEVQSASFDDIFVVDHERGLALLDDLEEEPNTREPGQGILSAKGEFIYEMEFYINSLLALSNNIKYISIQVFSEDPERKASTGSTDTSRASVHKMIGLLKEQETGPGNPASDPVKHMKSRKGSRKKYLGGTMVNLRSELSLEDLEKFKRFQEEGKEPEPEVYTYITDEPEEDLKEKEVSGVGRAAFNLKVDENMIRGSKAGITDGGSFHRLALRALHQEKKDPTSFALTQHPAAGSSGSVLGGTMDVVPTRRNERKNRKNTKRRRKKRQGHGSPGPRISLMRQSPVRASLKFSTGRNSIWAPAIAKIVQQTTKLESAPPPVRGKNPDVETSTSTAWTPPPPPAIVKFESRLIEVERTVSVPIRKTGVMGTIYWQVTLMRVKEIAGRRRLDPFMSRVYSVRHRAQTEEILTPVTPPDIVSSARMRGRNLLTVTQQDPVGTKVLIQRKTTNPQTSDVDLNNKSRYTTVAEIDLTAGMGPELITDSGVTNVGNTINIYRVCSIGPTGRMSEEYNSVVVKSLQPIAGTGSGSVSEETHVSIHARNDYNRIIVEITRLPPSAIAVTLLREDLSADSFTSNARRPLRPVKENGTGKTVIMIPKGTNSIRFDDHDVTPFKKYRYCAELRMSFGPAVEATGDEVIVHRRPQIVVPVKSAIRKTSLSNHKRRGTTQKGYEVSFDIATKPTHDGLETLAKILESSGVGEAFIDEVKRDRDRVSEIAAYVIERLDLKTGRREMLGLTSSGKFVDNSETQTHNRNSFLRPGHTYRYIAKLCLRPPEALFREAMTTIPVQHAQGTGGSRPDKTKVLAQKFLYAFGATPGMLPSDTELKKGSSQSISSLMHQGMTGVEIYTDVTIPNPPPIIENVRGHRTKKGQNIITWEANGDVDRIECFFIFARYKGTSGVVARIMNSDDGGRHKFKYTDRRLSGRVGKVEYTVGAMLEDCSRIKSSRPVTISRMRSMSPELLRNLKRRPRSMSKTKKPRRFKNISKLVKDSE